jgi:K+-transporting ATPase KdpF subunit
LRKGTLGHFSTLPLILPMENILIGLISMACLIYLVVAVLRPEKF